MSIDLTKLENLGPLKSGSHSDPSTGACVMEAAAYVAGEAWSDHPQCVSPVIGAFLRNWNDDLPNDAERNKLLKPLIPKILNTRADTATEERRSYLALDWLIRTYLPAWLRAAKLDDHADNIARLDPIVDIATAVDAAPVVLDARDAARDDAGDAARDAVRAAAGDAARNAARDAARDDAWAAAVRAAWVAAWSAARDAARDDAGDAARDAVRAAAWSAAVRAARDAAESALSETRDQLQLSAVNLVERMAALKDPT